MSQAEPAIPKGPSILGIISLVVGIIGALVSLIPCVGIVAIPIAGLGLLLGVIGLFVSGIGKQSGMGFPIAGTIVSLVGLVIGIVWIAMIGGLAYVGKEQAEKEAREIREGPAITIGAAELQSQYDENQMDADIKYKDKILEIIGKVDRVGREGFGQVDLKAGNETVECNFLLGQSAELARLQVGQQVTIRGRCKGKVVNVTLERCILIK